MIRFLCIVIVVVGYLILSIPILFVEWLIGKWNPYARDLSSLRIIQYVFKFILWITGAKVQVMGLEHVPKDQAVLYVGNHQSFFDILLTYSRCPGLTGYVAKDGMKKIPLLSTWMRRLYCLFLNRDDIKEGLKTILTGIEQVKKGISICIFPEGTRNRHPEGPMLPFKEGSMKIAEKSGCLIIPMAITGSANIFEHQFPKIRPAKVILEYGEPIDLKQLTKDQKKFLGAYTRDVIEQMRKKHQALL